MMSEKVSERVSEMCPGGPVAITVSYGGASDSLWLRVTEIVGPRAKTYEVEGRGGFMASLRAAVEMARGEGWIL